MKSKNNANYQNAVLNAIATTRSGWAKEGLIERVESLITNTAIEVSDQLFNSPLLKEIPSSPTSGEGWFPEFESLMIPERMANQILGLESNDTWALTKIGVLKGHFPRRPHGPWVFRSDLVQILKGELPEPKHVYEAYNTFDPSIFLFADTGYADRIKTLFKEDPCETMERLEYLRNSDYEAPPEEMPESDISMRITCLTAEYMLGLRKGDLKRLCKRGLFGEPDIDEEDSFLVGALIDIVGCARIELRVVE